MPSGSTDSTGACSSANRSSSRPPGARSKHSTIAYLRGESAVVAWVTMQATQRFAHRPSLRAAVAVALLTVVAGCGGGERDGSNGTPRTAGTECGKVDPFGAGTAAERVLVEQGRSDSGLLELFGAENRGVFDSVDELRSELMTELASEESIDIPSAEEPPNGCTPSGIEAQGFSRTALTTLGWTTGLLRTAVQAAPVKSDSTIGPRTDNDTYKSASGDAIQLSSTFGAVVHGHDSAVEVVVTASSTSVSGDVTSVETATLTASMNVCPDADGLAKGSLEGTFDGAGTDGSTYRGVIKDEFYVVVDDDAHATLTNHVYSSEYHATGAAATDVSAHGTATNTRSGVKGGTTLDASNGSAAAKKLVSQNLPFFAFAPSINVQSDAESKWREGTCVEVHADPQSPKDGALDAKPGESVSITATAFHKFEQSELDAPVVATLTGKDTVDPANEAVDSPAPFEYVAGDECKDKGTVNFKTTSKRGIGYGSTSFVTKADPDMECPDGQALNKDTCKCECKEEKSCPSGQSWDPESCQCACSPKKCPSGQRWDTASCACVCDQECPDGETLNVAQCRCEETCDLRSPTALSACKWTGTVHFTSNDSGSYSPTESQTITWNYAYDGTFTLEGDGDVLSISGPVSSSYKEVDVTENPGGCGLTITTDASIATDLDHVGFVTVLGGDTGTAQLSVTPFGDVPMGTQTQSWEGDDCQDDFVEDYQDQGAPSLSAYITVLNGNSSTGSTDDFSQFINVTRTLPDDSQTRFTMSWNLKLVHR